MIAVDTSSLRRFLAGERGGDVEIVAEGIDRRTITLPPVVLTEILSDRATAPLEEVLTALPILELLDGYWVRAGLLRARVVSGGHKARVADALIAQSCIDHEVPIVTNDRDFRHFVKHGLALVEW